MAIALSRIGCVVLAAGAAKRFAGDKLLAMFAGEPLLQRAIDAACGSNALSCTLVLGAHGEQIASAVNTRRCAVALNEEWRKGISSSIRCGLQGHEEDDACIIMLGDQPFVSAADLNHLIAAWSGRIQSTVQKSAAPIVALQAGAVWGAPALFPRRDFSALAKLTGDHGAKRYAAQQKQRLILVDAVDESAFEDVDTRADLTRLSESQTRRIRR
jgi:molybdenum cofactor cytidylyltransferase